MKGDFIIIYIISDSANNIFFQGGIFGNFFFLYTIFNTASTVPEDAGINNFTVDT
jgi:hypothetical protein